MSERGWMAKLVEQIEERSKDWPEDLRYQLGIALGKQTERERIEPMTDQEVADWWEKIDTAAAKAPEVTAAELDRAGNTVIQASVNATLKLRQERDQLQAERDQLRLALQEAQQRVKELEKDVDLYKPDALWAPFARGHIVEQQTIIQELAEALRGWRGRLIRTMSALKNGGGIGHEVVRIGEVIDEMSASPWLRKEGE